MTGVTAKAGSQMVYERGQHWLPSTRVQSPQMQISLPTPNTGPQGELHHIAYTGSVHRSLTGPPTAFTRENTNELEERTYPLLLLHAASPVKPPKIKLFSFTRMRTTVFTIASQAWWNLSA